MIITKSEPFTKGEITKIREAYDTYVKTVIDIEKKVCSAGANMHYESEKILLSQGSAQKDLWGGGLEVEEKLIDFNSFINIRPSQGNTSNEIQDKSIQEQYEKLTRFFFQIIL